MAAELTRSVRASGFAKGASGDAGAENRALRTLPAPHEWAPGVEPTSLGSTCDRTVGWPCAGDGVTRGVGKQARKWSAVDLTKQEGQHEPDGQHGDDRRHQ